MNITEKTKLKDMGRIIPILNVSGVDLLKACSKFELPEKIQGITPMKHSRISMFNQAWIWDTKDSKELLNAYVEIFFQSQTKKKLDEKWLGDCPLIDFYRFIYEVQQQSLRYAEQLSSIHVELTPEEKEAGYGEKDENGTLNLVLAMSNKRGISLEQAWNLPVVEYIVVFQNDAKESNRQRAYNKIISEKR